MKERMKREDLFVPEKRELTQSKRILYTPSGFARESLIYLQEVGTLTALTAHECKRRGLDSFLVFYVLDGNGKIGYNGVTYELNPGDLVFVDCRRPYWHSTDPEKLWKLSWIHFSGHSMEKIYQKYEERGGVPVWNDVDERAFRDLFDPLYRIADGDSSIRDMQINEQLSKLLTWLMEMAFRGTKDSDGHGKRDLSELREYLEAHFAEKITLDDLSERFFINKFYLTKIFREQFGISVNHYVMQLRITKAKQMLRFTDEKAETIGEMCGFGPLTYFSRAFRKSEGLSPTEYRKKWRG